jgi:hypothetical protein
MNTIGKKLVPLADIIKKFNESAEGKDFHEKLKKQEENDPARFNLKFDYQLKIDRQSADCNFLCAMDRFTSLEEMRSEWRNGDEHFSKPQFDEIFEEYQEYIIAAAQHVQSYRKRKKVLQRAVTKQDKLRKR